MAGYVFNEGDLKIIKSLSKNAKIFAVYTFLASLLLLAIGLAQSFGGASLMDKKISGGLGSFFTSIITMLVSVYHFKFVKGLRLINGENDIACLTKSLCNLNKAYIVYKGCIFS